jgi:hypothetical protein
VVLITLGGCHLLDGLLVVSVKAHKKIVWYSGEEICEGHLLALQEPRRETLVKRDAKGDKWSDWVKC